MAARKPLTAQEDLAEARRRAKTARTPIAKAVTCQVLASKQRTYSGQPATDATAQARRETQPAATSARRGTPKATSRKGTRR
jgi:hypothetical protein